MKSSYEEQTPPVPTNSLFTFSQNDPKVSGAQPNEKPKNTRNPFTNYGEEFLSPPPSAPVVRLTPGAGREKYQFMQALSGPKSSNGRSEYSLWGSSGSSVPSSSFFMNEQNLTGYHALENFSNPPYYDDMISQNRQPNYQAPPYQSNFPFPPVPKAANQQQYSLFPNANYNNGSINNPGNNVSTTVNNNPVNGSNTNNQAPQPSASSNRPFQHELSIPIPVPINPNNYPSTPGMPVVRSGSDSPPSPKKSKRKKDDISASKSDPLESPTSNLKFKQFYRGFKQKEKEGYNEAKAYAFQHFELLPDKIHWRIFLELADLAKRENRISEARDYYKQVNALQPSAAQGWLEYAKMEEECGNLKACKVILNTGLSHCPVNESLMVKCLKHYERMEHLVEARALLGALKDIPIERTWRTIMEGGLLEARQGNVYVARQVFKFLIKNVPWYGPIYQEACRFEEKCEEHRHAMRFVKKGLQENPRYGPLWFSALRLHEKLAEDGNMSGVHETIENAIKSISKELIWKLYFEAAQIEERAGNLAKSRDFYVSSVKHCPDNLLWKVWMGGARTELNYGNIAIARKLLKRALKEVPPKMKAMVLLECSRLEEYALKLDKAREILAKAKKYTKHEWKVFLESVLLEMRANNLSRAIKEAQLALDIHTGTGRLWAVMIQLKQAEGHEEQMQVFRKALSEVPKSGEVWCEGARIALQQKDFVAARKYINFAIQFTPQYGDSFIEFLRLELLENGNKANLVSVEQACVNADPNYGALWLHCKKNALDSTRNVVREAIRLLTTPDGSGENPAATALLVNQIYQDIHQKSEEERRKSIFL